MKEKSEERGEKREGGRVERRRRERGSMRKRRKEERKKLDEMGMKGGEKE